MAVTEWRMPTVVNQTGSETAQWGPNGQSDWNKTLTDTEVPGGSSPYANTMAPTFQLGKNGWNVTRTLSWSGFGFSIPAGNVVTGVEVMIARVCQSGGAVYDHLVQLRTTSPVGVNMASAQAWRIGNASNNYLCERPIYGSDSSVWGASLTSELVNSAAFGFDLQAATNASSTVYGNIEVVAMRVHYTEGMIIQPPVELSINAGFAFTATAQLAHASVYPAATSSFSVAAYGPYATAREGQQPTVSQFPWIGQYKSSATTFEINQVMLGFDLDVPLRISSTWS